MTTEAQLLQEFVASGSEAAFTELVKRHAGAVHAAAMRQTSDPHLAEEVTQAVFVLLARKAASLKPGVVLLGWLLQATRYAAADLLKAERRRRHRETAAFQMNTILNSETTEEPSRIWDRVAPVLDACLARLREGDRHALLLRFFQNRSFIEVGAGLGVAEEAARKRVNRALEKLRSELERHGAVTSMAALPGLLATHAAPAAPEAVVAPTVSAALSQGSAGAAKAVALSQNTASAMAWNGLRVWLASAAAAVALVGGGWGGLTWWQHRQAQVVSADGDYRLAGFSDPQVVHGFIRDLQQQIRAGEREAVARSVRFPLEVNGRGFSKPVAGEAAMLAAFEQVFTESVAGEILKCPLQRLHCTEQGVMVGGGSIWIAPDKATGRPQIAIVNLP